MKDIALNKLRDKCILFNNFLIKELHVPKELLSDTILSIENAFINKDTKSLMAASRDIDSQIKEIPMHYFQILKAEFRNKLGLDIEIIKKRNNLEVKRIIKRNVIKDEYEYRLLIEVINDISSIESNTATSINNILMLYEKK